VFKSLEQILRCFIPFVKNKNLLGNKLTEINIKYTCSRFSSRNTPTTLEPLSIEPTDIEEATDYSSLLKQRWLGYLPFTLILRIFLIFQQKKYLVAK
jgi:hypothetical protein